MKGHVGGGYGYWRFRGVGGSDKAKSFHVLICKHTLCIVQERLLEVCCLDLGYSAGVWMVHQLESLILAQNERWRHA